MMSKQYNPPLLYFILSIVLSMITFDVQAQKNIRKQIKIKAAFIFQMAKFVNWTVHPDTPLVFCSYSDPNQYNILTVLTTLKAQGKLKIQNYDVTLKALTNNHDDVKNYSDCSLIYFTPNIEHKIPSKILKSLSQHKLIVGNSIAFVAKGGLTALIPEKGKNKLYINRSSYEQSEIKIRSRLMSLARMHPQ